VEWYSHGTQYPEDRKKKQTTKFYIKVIYVIYYKQLINSQLN